MANVNENEQRFILLNDRYVKSCAVSGITPLRFYYENGWVKCSKEKSKRLDSFEKFITSLEQKIDDIKVEQVVEDLESVYEAPAPGDQQSDDEVEEQPKKSWWKFW